MVQRLFSGAQHRLNHSIQPQSKGLPRRYGGAISPRPRGRLLLGAYELNDVHDLGARKGEL